MFRWNFYAAFTKTEMFMHVMRKITKYLSQDLKSPSRGLKSGDPEYEERMQITTPQHSNVEMD
jgi:hypothetical protein